MSSVEVPFELLRIGRNQLNSSSARNKNNAIPPTQPVPDTTNSEWLENPVGLQKCVSGLSLSNRDLDLKTPQETTFYKDLCVARYMPMNNIASPNWMENPFGNNDNVSNLNIISPDRELKTPDIFQRDSTVAVSSKVSDASQISMEFTAGFALSNQNRDLSNPVDGIFYRDSSIALSPNESDTSLVSLDFHGGYIPKDRDLKTPVDSVFYGDSSVACSNVSDASLVSLDFRGGYIPKDRDLKTPVDSVFYGDSSVACSNVSDASQLESSISAGTGKRLPGKKRRIPIEELTPEEARRALRKRETNKRAARRFRQLESERYELLDRQIFIVNEESKLLVNIEHHMTHLNAEILKMCLSQQCVSTSSGFPTAPRKIC